MNITHIFGFFFIPIKFIRLNWFNINSTIIDQFDIINLNNEDIYFRKIETDDNNLDDSSVF